MGKIPTRVANADNNTPLLQYADGSNGIEDPTSSEEKIPVLQIFAMLAPAFSWGCVSTTMILLTLPLECQRVADSFSTSSDDNTSSIFLALFVFLGGLTELMCPIMGKMSDESISIPNFWGRRIPFILLGSLLATLSMLGMSLSSWFDMWIIYSIAYTLFMTGMNIIYSSMIALVPDLIPTSQVGQANGVLALEMVVGSLFGFIMFEAFVSHNNSHVDQDNAVRLAVIEMYVTYMFTLVSTCIFALKYTKERTDVNAEKNPNSSVTSLESHPTGVWSRITKLFVIWKQAMFKVYAIRGKEFLESYTVSPSRHGDFFYVTVSRTFYYMGISVQTFFLYYIHDILRKHSALARESPETLVSTLALIVQFSGVFTSYPAGYVSDTCYKGRRKPLIYLSCFLLSAGTLSLIFVQYVNQVKIVSVLVGLANGGYLTMETSLAVDSLEKMEAEHQNRIAEEEAQLNGTSGVSEEKEGAAQLLGIWGVAAFVGVALGPLIGGPLLFFFGRVNENNLDDFFDDDYVGGQQYDLLGYIIVFSLSSIYFALSAVALKWVKNCD